MKKAFLYIGLICILLIPGACSIVDTGSTSSDDLAMSYENSVPVSDLSDVGCKKAVTKSTTGETVFLKSLGDNTLQIRHCDVYYNCAANLDIKAYVSGQNIHIVEKETSTVANCTCPFDFKFNIRIAYKTYSLYINNRYVGEFTFNSGTDTSLKMYK